MRFTRSVVERLAVGVVAGLVAFGLAYVSRPPRDAPRAPRPANVLEADIASFELHPSAGELSITSRDRLLQSDLDLVLVVDGTPRPLVLAREDMHPAAGSIRIDVPIAMGDTFTNAELNLSVDRARGILSLDVRASPDFVAGGHTLGLRAELASGGHVVFVPEVGQIADRATVAGSALLVDALPHPIGILSTRGPIAVDAVPDDAQLPVQPIRLSATSPMTAAGPDPATTNLRIVVGASSLTIWNTFAAVVGTPTALVRGHVMGTTEPALVFGRDAQGKSVVRAHTNAGGAFDIAVPRSVVEWYAAIDPGRSSRIVPFEPGTSRDLVLDISPGGDLHVIIKDADTGLPLTARLLVHGLDGTLDPSFGPDYRASGAGPVIDTLRGDVSTPLPSGRYRVAATKGLEWSIDAKTVTIAPGRETDVELAPRHVVPTPGVVGCDLHVHARPSFDTPVTPEDRVVSLVAAGVDFAVPTEHNVVGDYSSSLETLDLGRDLLSVPGIEITTYSKGFGHFGVFPYSPTAPLPPYKHTNMASIFRAVRSGDPNRYFQLNHPRLPKGIGYFNNIGFDPKAPRSRLRGRIDFDGIEVYNGYDTELPERVDQVLRDYWALLDFGWRFAATGSSDSHRIQFHWAGYPRTMVMVDPNPTPESERKPLDPLTVVANVKKGHAVVTSGPILEFEIAGARPGDEADTTDDPLSGHLRVRAAPWIDVTRVEIVWGEVGGTARVIQTIDVPSRPTEIGPEPGLLEQAQDRTIRLDRDLALLVGPQNGWVQVIARGERRMDDILPFMPVPPLAFTNPVYIVRRSVPPPPMPGAPASIASGWTAPAPGSGSPSSEPPASDRIGPSD